MTGANEPPGGSPVAGPETDLGDRLRGSTPSPSAPHQPRPGGRWGRFEILQLLGQGGMGRVYLAIDPSLGRRVALKLLTSDEPQQLTRFLAEARGQARVEHEHVCRVYEVGEAEGRPYIAMQYVDGPSLRQAPPEMSLEQRVKALREVAEAVHEAHKIGLIHRDLKPANILLEAGPAGWHPYVTDFGIARAAEEPGLTKTGVLLGTLEYLAPEAALGRSSQPDRRLDVWGLGVTLYELLTGRLPFEGGSEGELFGQLLTGDPVPIEQRRPDLPRDLATIVGKALERDPQRRYDSARALADDLGRFLDGEPIEARRPSRSYRLAKWVQRNRLLAGVSAGAVLLVLTFAGLFLEARWDAAARAELAQRFGREVQSLETLLRVAHLLPLHDTTPSREEVRRRMAEMRARIAEGGRRAEGPGAYALGRGHLALAEPQAARAQLERAWRAGFRDPEVSAALGQALGLLYRSALREAENLPGASQREAERERARRELRAPALEALRRAAAEGGREAAHLEGLIDFYDERFDAALAKGRAAVERDPSRWEGLALGADALSAIGNAHAQGGRLEQALEALGESEVLYQRASLIARSDPSLYLGLCRSRLRRLEVHRQQGRERPANLDGILEPCRQALTAQPGLAEAYATQAHAHWRFAQSLVDAGLNPGAVLDQAVALASQASDLDPESPYAPTTAGTAEVIRAEYQMLNGQDPRPALDRAIEDFEEAIRRAPGWVSAANEIGLAYWNRATWEMSQGLDPATSFDRAEQSLKRAIAALPGYANAHHNLGLVLDYRADWEASRDIDPEPTRLRARPCLLEAIRLTPTDGLFHSNLAASHLKQAVWELAKNRDPQANLEAARKGFERSAELNDRDPNVRSNLGFTWVSLADWERRQGHDPRPSLKRAIEEVDKALDTFPNFALAVGVLGEAWSCQARWEVDTGRDPRSSLAKAENAFAHTVAINRNLSGEVEKLRAANRELAARWQAQR
ncbi:MAG TPA: protein kinase [Thermoanaerobaculia bacterium]|nr:protein kinase [Thermoanaerobaculia bacterium]